LSDSGSIDAATLDSIDSTSFLRSDAADTKTSGDLTFSDDVKAIFGSALDGLQIYNTAAGDKLISEAGSGNLKIQGDNLYLQNSAGTENYISALTNGAVTLHFDNSPKLVTTSGGIDVTGTITFDGGTTSADLNFDDNTKAVFGGSSDLKIYHDGLNSYIQDSGTGDLKIYAANFGMWNATGASNYMTATDGGAVTLAHAGTTKLATTSSGIDVTGEVQADSIVLNDSETIYLGNSADLRIYHDGSNSYVEDTGTGDLRIKGVDVVIQQSDGNNQVASQSGGAVSLSHNGSTKLATASGGIDVTGTVTATAFSGDGSALTGIAGFPSSTLMLFQQTAAPTGWTKQTTHNDKALRVVSGTAGSGGSSAFTTAFGTPTVSGSVSVSGNISNTTLSVSQIPSHSHSYNKHDNNATGGNHTHNGPNDNGDINTSNAGGGGSHNHGHNISGNLSSATAGINVQYVDLIIASKD
jgi:hypothetical protein